MNVSPKYNHICRQGLLLMLFGSLLVSCSKDIEPDEDYCLREDNRDLVCLNLAVQKSMFTYKNLDIDDENNVTISRSAEKEEPHIRYYINVYPADCDEKAKPIYSTTTTEPQITLSLPIGKCRVIAWADYVTNDDGFSKYFHTDDFSDMLLIDKYDYTANDPYKSCFLCSKDVTVSYKTPLIDMKLMPLMGQYRIVASDQPDYEVGKILVSYPSGVAASVNAFTGNICHVWQDVSFKSECDSYVVFDNILAEKAESEIHLAIKVFDEDGRLRAYRRSIKFPIVRQGVTTATTNVFTLLEDENPGDNPGTEGGGQAGINDKYDTTYIITF